MLDLLISVLLMMGFNVNGNHFTMNSNNAIRIKSTNEYKECNCDREFIQFVSIDDKLTDDVIVVDDPDPNK
jgi:hypothetical protein